MRTRMILACCGPRVNPRGVATVSSRRLDAAPRRVAYKSCFASLRMLQVPIGARFNDCWWSAAAFAHQNLFKDKPLAAPSLSAPISRHAAMAVGHLASLSCRSAPLSVDFGIGFILSNRPALICFALFSSRAHTHNIALVYVWQGDGASMHCNQ